MLRVSALIPSLACLGIAVVAVGCTQNRAAAVHPPPGYFDAHAAPVYVGAAPASSGTVVAAQGAGPCAPPPCAPPPCAPPPCPPPPCPPPCGLPCENGISNWHVRALAGFPFMFGTDAGEGCNYFGVDVGTTRCNCVGFDAFYRVEFCDNNRNEFDPTNSPTSRIPAAHFDRNLYGEDGGMIQFIGLKATYQHSLGSGNLYWWVGAGPEYFWTSDYIDDDDGFGFFGEVGLGWKFSQNWAVRLGVDFHGDYTSVTREDISDSGDARMMWTVAPHVGIEFSF